jgi:Cys-rich four helix bundle protein (predicted Tat secretion target)
MNRCQIISRRRILTAASAATALLVFPALGADTTHTRDLESMSNALFDSLQGCIRAAELCQAHCQRMLAAGNSSIADCSQAVNALLPACQALAVLTVQRSSYLPRYAALTRDMCLACEKECRKHASEHTECRNCADACSSCAKRCDVLAG